MNMTLKEWHQQIKSYLLVLVWHTVLIPEFLQSGEKTCDCLTALEQCLALLLNVLGERYMVNFLRRISTPSNFAVLADFPAPALGDFRSAGLGRLLTDRNWVLIRAYPSQERPRSAFLHRLCRVRIVGVCEFVVGLIVAVHAKVTLNRAPFDTHLFLLH